METGTEAAEQATADRIPLVKAHFVSSSGVVTEERADSITNALDEQSQTLYQLSGVVEPPYDPALLVKLHEHSNSLRSNVDAYATNIDGFGHHFEPVIDVENDDKVFDKIAKALLVESYLEAEITGSEPQVPTDAEVEKKKAELEAQLALEAFKLDRFFRFASTRMSFMQLRKQSREDLEITGNGYWEVVRGRNNSLWSATLNYLPALMMRLTRETPEFVEVEVPTLVAPLKMGLEKIQRRFRRYVQVMSGGVANGKLVFFKEYGDPRVMSARSGRYYGDARALEKGEPGAAAATEVIHFRVHSSRTPYGIPRWIGNLLSVLGSRQAEEVNFAFFENKTIPPMVICVSNGRFSESSVQRIEDFLESRVKGKQNFHKALILEAVKQTGDYSDQAGRMKIEIVPLTKHIQQDAMFQNYDERNIDKVGMAFRLPRLLRGDIRDFNRGTAREAIQFTEQQVFGGLRAEFDWQMDRLLDDMGVHLHRYKSNGVAIRDPKEMASVLKDLASTGGLVPADVRRLASELVLQRELPTIDADWPDQPIMLTQVGVPLDDAPDGVIPTGPKPQRPGAGDVAGQLQVARNKAARARTEAGLVAEVRRLMRVRDVLMREEAKASRKPEGETLELEMDRDEIVKAFGIVPESTRVDSLAAG